MCRCDFRVAQRDLLVPESAGAGKRKPSVIAWDYARLTPKMNLGGMTKEARFSFINFAWHSPQCAIGVPTTTVDM